MPRLLQGRTFGSEPESSTKEGFEPVGKLFSYDAGPQVAPDGGETDYHLATRGPTGYVQDLEISGLAIEHRGKEQDAALASALVGIRVQLVEIACADAR